MASMMMRMMLGMMRMFVSAMDTGGDMGMGGGMGWGSGNTSVWPGGGFSPWGMSPLGVSPWSLSPWGSSPWGSSPWGGSPWGGSPWGGSPWGGSPWGGSPWNGGPGNWGQTPWGSAPGYGYAPGYGGTPGYGYGAGLAPWQSGAAPSSFNPYESASGLDGRWVAQTGEVFEIRGDRFMLSQGGMPVNSGNLIINGDRMLTFSPNAGAAQEYQIAHYGQWLALARGPGDWLMLRRSEP